MTEQERIKMLQQRERSRAAAAYKPSQGPNPGSPLTGQRGVPEDVPLDQLTPQQRKDVDYTPFAPGVPRLPRTGVNMWDGTINEGAGGYVPRAPDPDQFGAAAKGQEILPSISFESEVSKMPMVRMPAVSYQKPPQSKTFLAGAPIAGLPAFSQYPGTGGAMADHAQDLMDRFFPKNPVEEAAKEQRGTPVNTPKTSQFPRNTSVVFGNGPTELKDKDGDTVRVVGGKYPTDIDPDALARSLGIDPSAYPPEARPKLEADTAAALARHERLSKKFDSVQVPGGGYRYKPNAATVAEGEARKGKSALRTLSSRWAREMNADRDGDGKPDFNSAMLEAAYNDPSLAGMSHTERMKFVNDKYIDQFRNDRSSRIQLAVEERAKHDNMARRLGVPVSNVMFHSDLANAQSPEDRIRVLLSYHAMAPQLGLGNMAAYIQRGQDEARSMEAMSKHEQAKAEAADPNRRLNAANAANAAMPPGMAKIDALKAAAKAASPGGNITPEALNDAVVSGGLADVRKLASQRGLSPDEQLHIKEWTAALIARNGGQSNYKAHEAFARQLGLLPYSDQARRLWKVATGKDPMSKGENSYLPDGWYNWWAGIDPAYETAPDPGSN
jgi:hypothetical protein